MTSPGAPPAWGRRLRAWLPPALWMGLMFTASGDAGSPAHTSRLLELLLQPLALQAGPEALATIHLAVRKLAHLAEYAVLAALVRHAMLRSRAGQHGDARARVLLPAFAFVAVFALADEWHQGFVATRTAAIADVLLDCAGAAVALAVACAATGRRATGDGGPASRPAPEARPPRFR